MIWNEHLRDFPQSGHALFSPSQPTWMNDQTAEDVVSRYYRSLAQTIGVLVHEEAHDCIVTNTRYTKNEAKKSLTKKLLLNKIPRGAFDEEALANNFVKYVNDAIGFMMKSEQRLFYSKWCAGTADAIIFDETKRILRIHDLKTGTIPGKLAQLEGYAALFFLEYGTFLGVTPGDCQIILRIYQGGEIVEEAPSAEIILPIMDSCIWHTQILNSVEEG